MYPLNSKQLLAIMPRLPLRSADKYLPHIIQAMDEWLIDNTRRIAAFLAQLAHESCELRVWEEIATGRAYEGRLDLGNTIPGDGVRYKGRGPIQLTGRLNYRLAGQALQLDLEEHPERVLEPGVGFRVAGWYWYTHGLNRLADRGKFTSITRRINGGLNGMHSRLWYWGQAKQVLGV